MLELVGGPNLADDLGRLATGGRIAVIGVGGGARAELDLLGLMGKRARIHGSTLRARPARAEGRRRAAGRPATSSPRSPPAACGSRSPPPTRWPTPPTAYDHFAAGAKLGKIVLTAEGAQQAS